MKALKLMLSGLMLTLVALICIMSAMGIVGIFLILAGIALFVWGLMTK